MRPGRPHDLIDRLIDWNLDLAAARVNDRAHLAEKAARLQGDVSRIALPPADRELAESLLQTGTWLAANDDPLGVAERFDAVADQLLGRIQAAADAGERKRTDRLSRRYRRVLKRGIDPNVQRPGFAGVELRASGTNRAVAIERRQPARRPGRPARTGTGRIPQGDSPGVGTIEEASQAAKAGSGRPAATTARRMPTIRNSHSRPLGVNDVNQPSPPLTVWRSKLMIRFLSVLTVLAVALA